MSESVRASSYYFMLLPTDDDYAHSTALVLTFVVNNDKNEEFQTMATEWESAFLNLTASYASDNITVRYSAEVIYPKTDSKVVIEPMMIVG
jgi:hypothetical protein